MIPLWQLLLTAAVTHGPGMVDFIQRKWNEKGDPTPEEIAELKKLINKPGEDYFK